MGEKRVEVLGEGVAILRIGAASLQVFLSGGTFVHARGFVSPPAACPVPSRRFRGFPLAEAGARRVMTHFVF